MDDSTINWGIMGTGWIAQQMLRDLPFAKDARAVAVGSRTKESAVRFAKEFSIDKAYGSYEELVQDPLVDVIYVATPHPFHYENVMLSLQAGKSVLCEKPLMMNRAQTQKVIELAKEKHLFFMEAMWTRFLPAIQKVREWIAQGRIGDVRMVKADFGFQAPDDPTGRLLNKSLGGGALLDAGIYPVSFASMIYGQQPMKIMSCAHIGATGVDEQFSLVFSYPSGKSASLNGAVRVNLRSEAYIYGTKGYIHIPAPFLSTKEASLYIDNIVAETFADASPCMGYAYEVLEVGRCLREGVVESLLMPMQESLAIMETLDQIRDQWNLRYPFE